MTTASIMFLMAVATTAFAAEQAPPKTPAPLKPEDRAAVWELRAKKAELANEHRRLVERIATIEKVFPSIEKALDEKVGKINADYKAEGYALDDDLNWKPIKPVVQSGAPAAPPKQTQP